MNIKIKKIDTYRIYLALLIAASAASVLLVCWFLRNVVLGCHDSIAEFTYARMWPLEQAYMHTRNFCLARGRAGFLFPLVVTFRYLINGTGNYYAVWLLQQVPIWFDAGLISWIIGKKTKAHYGIYFLGFFAAFVQIDVDHSLFVCYPLDFMYGLGLMILGLYLYDGWLERKGNKKVSNWVRLSFSLFCYYESMQVYEAFIMACLGYAAISLIHVIKHRKEYGKKSLLKFIIQLIPHGVDALIYVGILVYLRLHPVTDVSLSSGEVGTPDKFVQTWLSFSTSLIPLRHRYEIDISDTLIATFTDPFLGLSALAAGLAAVMLFLCIVKRFPSHSKEEQKKINLTLLSLAAVGAIVALCFTMPLGIDSKYQYWVCDLGAKGYMPSSICYYGWAMALACLGSLAANFISNLKNYIRIPLYTFAVICLMASASLTAGINVFYACLNSAVGFTISNRAQVFYAFATSDDVEAMGSEYVYIGPGFSGIHNMMNMNDDYATCELGRPCHVMNNYEEFAQNAEGAPNPSKLAFDGSSFAYYALIDNPTDPEKDWITTDNIVILTTRPEPIIVTYYDSTTGTQETVTFPGGRFGSFVISNSDAVETDSIKIAFAEG